MKAKRKPPTTAERLHALEIDLAVARGEIESFWELWKGSNEAVKRNKDALALVECELGKEMQELRAMLRALSDRIAKVERRNEAEPEPRSFMWSLLGRN